MKILVTGSTGFVGKHLVKKLKKEKHEIVEINSTNFTSMWNLEKNTIDVIVHLAVKTEAGGYCQKHPGEQWVINNSINADMLAYWADNQQRAHMITFGSSCGYNNNVIKSEDNYLTGEPEEGYEVYGMAKRNLLVGLKALNKEFFMSYNYLIPSVFYGPDYNLNDKHFIFDLIRKIKAAKDLGYNVTLWGDGTQERELIYIDDAIELIMACIDNTESPTIFNLSSGKTHTLKEYAQAICDIVDFDSKKIVWDEDQFVGSPSKKLINTHLKEYKFTTLKKGLIKTIKYYEDCIRNGK